MNTSNISKEYLEYAILVENRSYTDIGKEFGCTGSNIYRKAQKLGIPLKTRCKRQEKQIHTCLYCGKNFKHKSWLNATNIFCSEKCRKSYIHQEKYKLVLEGDPSIMNTNFHIANFKPDILKEQNYKCAICGIPSEWNNKPLVFVLDHIDGHASNNKRDNLRCICPNCDSQLPTYKSKNLKSDRIFRYYKVEKGPVKRN